MPPSILLSLVIASCYGCGFHVVFGRRMWQWALFWLAALAGFFAGYVGGIATGLELLRVGSIPLLSATIGAFAALALSWWFSHPYAESREPGTGNGEP